MFVNELNNTHYFTHAEILFEINENTWYKRMENRGRYCPPACLSLFAHYNVGESSDIFMLECLSVHKYFCRGTVTRIAAFHWQSIISTVERTF